MRTWPGHWRSPGWPGGWGCSGRSSERTWGNREGKTSFISDHKKILPPLGEIASVLLVLLAPLVEVVQPLGGGLAVLSAKQLLHTFVDLKKG